MECQFCNLELGEHTVHGQGICGKHAEKLIRRIEALEKLVAAQQSVHPTSACCRAEIIPGIRQGEPSLCATCGGTCG